MEAKDILTLGIAGYGAALSTYNLIQGLRRDRKQLKVSMSTAMYTYPTGLGPAMVSIEVVNAGHRPLLVNGPTLRLADGRTLALWGADGWSDFPKHLGDGASAAIRIPYRDVAQALREAGCPDRVEVTPVCSESTGLSFTGKPWTVNVPEWLGM